MRAWQSGALSGQSWNDYSREIWGRGRAADTCWATCHFGTQEGQECHLCSLKLDGRLLLPLLPNCFPILFQRDIGVRRPACVGVRWTLERKTRSSLNEVMRGVLHPQFHNVLLEWVLLICDAYAPLLHKCRWQNTVKHLSNSEGSNVVKGNILTGLSARK